MKVMLEFVYVGVLRIVIDKYRAEAAQDRDEARRLIRSYEEKNAKADALEAVLDGELRTEDLDTRKEVPDTIAELDRRRSAVRLFVERVGLTRNADVIDHLVAEGFELGEDGAAKSKVHGDLKFLVREGVVAKTDRGTWAWAGRQASAEQSDLLGEEPAL